MTLSFSLVRRLAALAAGASLAGCGGREPVPAPRAVASASAFPIASTSMTTPPSAGTSAAPLEPPRAPLTSISLVLHPGDEPCTIVFDGDAEDRPDAWFLRGVRHLKTVKGPACAGGSMFDTDAEASAGPGALAALPALFWLKPGHALPKDDDLPVSDFPPGIADLDFDGWLDVCAAIDPTSEAPQRCWLFDHQKRVFVRSPAIDVIPNLRVDAENQALDGYTRSGSVYEGTEYTWIGGKLELTRRRTQWLGEKPNGDRIPGYVYVVVEERRGGRMVRVRDGAVKE